MAPAAAWRNSRETPPPARSSGSFWYAPGVWVGLILAGGRSRRMGCDKALLSLRGRTLLQRAIDLVRAAGGEAVVVGRHRAAEQVAGAAQIDDTQGPEGARGPLGALQHGLRVCGGRPALALACDVPLVPVDLVRFLMREAERYDAVVPRAGGVLHVLAAAYTEACLEAVDRQLAAGVLSVHRVLPEVRLRIVEEEELAPFGGGGVLLNVNTREDLERADRLLAGGESGPTRGPAGGPVS
jgi:molybdopterin-guanine dinucleotide biosynthesis protein A